MGKITYEQLGQELKTWRERQLESLDDVAGAVEIDRTALEQIEAGHERPEEEILLLLINHFSMPDEEADKLWELAGYAFEEENGDTEKQPLEQLVHEMLQGAAKPIMMMLSVESRAVYVNDVQVSTDKTGVTMNFAQTNAKGQPQVVARVGMSYEQAQETLRNLQVALLKVQKRLPPQAD